jgi:hypothetical protein
VQAELPKRLAVAWGKGPAAEGLEARQASGAFHNRQRICGRWPQRGQSTAKRCGENRPPRLVDFGAVRDCPRTGHELVRTFLSAFFDSVCDRDRAVK